MARTAFGDFREKPGGGKAGYKSVQAEVPGKNIFGKRQEPGAEGTYLPGPLPQPPGQIPQFLRLKAPFQDGQGDHPGKGPGPFHAGGEKGGAQGTGRGPAFAVRREHRHKDSLFFLSRFHKPSFRVIMLQASGGSARLSSIQRTDMKYKTKLLAERFTRTLSQWPSVECVSLNEAAFPDTLDPYFALILDVFHRETVPEAAERCRLYGNDVAAFESFNGKDRFLIGDIPVRLEYKAAGKIEELVSIAKIKSGSIWLIKDAGTYGFYRLAQGEALFSRSGWIDRIRSELEQLGGAFWNEMRLASQSKMEHYLSDLGAAVFQSDSFNTLISSASFIKNACLTLFCANRRFEPSHRAYFKQVLELPVVPESFPTLFKTFLLNDPEMTMERRYSVARLIAGSIIKLG
jgi:hypothetical protein